MRLVDFLVALLSAHAQTLQRLAALLGEDPLLELLEAAAEENPAAKMAQEKGTGKIIRPARLDLFEANTTSKSTQGSAYALLESAVRDQQLAAVLEFHLWTYPHYRAFIESPLDLTALAKPDAGVVLIEEAMAQAHAWIKRLPVGPDLGKRVEAASQVAWLRFRTDVMRRIGKSPLSAV